MKNPSLSKAALCSLFLLLPVHLAPGLGAATQELSLQPGWNAVFLELQPDDAAPERVFAGQPVEMCAVWLPVRSKVGSLVDPAAVPTKAAEWHIWQPAENPASFLNNLHALTARHAMLIKCSAAATVTIRGEPFFARRKWIAPSFNFTGFDVDPSSPPSFARFFDGSRAHDELKIFKLVNGLWQRVAPADAIERGVGYWVWCKQGSDFQGPLDLSLRLAGKGELVLQNGAAPSVLTLRANGSLPVDVSISPAGALPVAVVLDGKPAGTGQFTMSGAQRKTIGLQRRLDAAPDHAGAMISIRGGGMHLTLPVRGTSGPAFLQESPR